MNKKLTFIFTTLGLIGMTAMAFADVGIQTEWFFRQLSLIVLIVSVGLGVMFFVQKQTAKMITTLVVGALLYIIAVNPTGTFSALGTFLKGLFGLG